MPTIETIQLAALDIADRFLQDELRRIEKRKLAIKLLLCDNNVTRLRINQKRSCSNGRNNPREKSRTTKRN